MKYIDAEKLIAEIERRISIKENLTQRPEMNDMKESQYDIIGAYQSLKSFITSLQQEQQKKEKNCSDCPHCVDRKDQYGWHFKGCFGGPYKGKFIAEIDECPLKQEELEVDLEKEAIKFVQSKEFIESKESPVLLTARHFYELGLNAKKES